MAAHLRTALAVFGVLLLTLVVQVTEVCAWGCVGHMLVAEIARRRLDPANAHKMEVMGHNFYNSGPFRWSPDMVQAACWADDAKEWHQYAMRTWHFVDIPYNPENVTIDEPLEAVNAVTVSKNMIEALRHAKAPLYMLNFAWVNLVHFVGDLHQPLHATTLYSHKYPHGDRGGNSINVKVHGREVRLHALWDDICDVPAPHYKRPLSETDAFAIAALADRMEDENKFPMSLRKMVDPHEMAEESHNYAINSSYADVKPHEELGESYLRRCKTVAEGRIVLGGYRLGYLLNDLLSNITVSEEAEKAYRAHQQRKRLQERENKLAKKGKEHFRFREVLTVERKVYQREDEHDGVLLSREETVRNGDRADNRDNREGYWPSDL